MNTRVSHPTSATIAFLAFLTGLCACEDSASDSLAITVSYTTNTVSFDSAEIEYDDAGSGETILFLHGVTCDRTMWNGLFSDLAARYRVVQFDMRGHGRSSGVEGDFSRASDVIQFLDSLSIERAHFIGLSMGAEVALEVAQAAPQRVSSLTLMSPFLGLDTTHAFDLRVLTYALTSASEGLEAGLTEWLTDPLFDSIRSDPTLYDAVRKMVLVGHLAQGDGAYFVNGVHVAAPITPIEEGLSKSSMPSLVLVGDRDLERFQTAASDISEALPNSDLIKIPNSGHLVNLENPQVVLESLLHFLDSH